jgi:hypothetical protein
VLYRVSKTGHLHFGGAGPTGGRSQAEECRKHAFTPNLLAPWQAAFLLRGRNLIFDDDSARSAEQVRIAALEQILRAHDPGE